MILVAIIAEVMTEYTAVLARVLEHIFSVAPFPRRVDKNNRLEFEMGAPSEGLRGREKSSSRGHHSFVGVRQRPSGRWVAEIKDSLQKVRLWLGTFNTYENAARAYEDAARALRGDNTRTNFELPQSSTNSSGACACFAENMERFSFDDVCCTGSVRRRILGALKAELLERKGLGLLPPSNSGAASGAVASSSHSRHHKNNYRDLLPSTTDAVPLRGVTVERLNKLLNIQG